MSQEKIESMDAILKEQREDLLGKAALEIFQKWSFNAGQNKDEELALSFKPDFPGLKDTDAAFEKGEFYGAILTFPTADNASSFLKISSAEDYKDYVDQINDTTFYLSLEFAAFVYCYPGADFSNLNQLNSYTGYKKEDKNQQSFTEEKQLIIESPKDIPKNSHPVNVSKVNTKFFSFSPKKDTDTFKFKKEQYAPDFYKEEECAQFVGQKELTEFDKELLDCLPNCTTFPTLTFYLEKIHGYDAIVTTKAINTLDNESQNTLKTLTPIEVIDFIEKELEVKNKM